MIKTKWELGMNGGIVIGNPIPEEYSLDLDDMDKIIEQALVEADQLGVKGKEVTLFMLGKVKELTAGESFAANLELLYNNARNSTKLAIELAKLYNA